MGREFMLVESWKWYLATPGKPKHSKGEHSLRIRDMVEHLAEGPCVRTVKDEGLGIVDLLAPT